MNALTRAVSGIAALVAAAPAHAGVFPYPVHTASLDNGLEVYVVPMPTPGVVAWHTWMAVGSGDEVVEGRTGFAHFFEHLMFYGSDALPREVRERELLRLGASENAWTWLDETVYHVVVRADALPDIARIEADRFLGLKLSDDVVRREAGAVRGEFLKGRASPDAVLAEAVYAAAFPDHPYGHDTIGVEADIEAMPDALEHARSFFDTYYRPERARILISGDVDPEAAFALVEQHFGAWEPLAEARSPAAIPAQPAQEARRDVAVPWPGAAAARLTLAWRIPPHDPDDPDVAALQLVEELLLSDVGPLKRRLVDEEGLVYEVWGGRDSFVAGALFTVSTMLRDPSHLDRVEQIIGEEVEALHTAVDAGRLDRARTHARYAALLELDAPAPTATALGWAARRGGVDALDRFQATVDAVTPQALADAVGRHLVDEHLVHATLIPTEDAP